MLAHRRKGVAGVYQKQRYLNRRPGGHGAMGGDAARTRGAAAQASASRPGLKSPRSG